MKCFGLIFLFYFFTVAVKAQDADAILHAADSLSNYPEKAVMILNEALVTNPDSEELLKVRAEAYENLKQYDKAVADYKKLTELSPDEENLWYLLGRNLYKSGQLQDALKVLDRATRMNSTYLPAFHTKIQILLQLNRNEDALKVSDSTLMVGETAMNYFLQGEVYKRLNSRQKSEWAFDKATKIDKGYIEAYIALADLAASANKPAETLKAAEDAIAIDPDSKEALIARSRGFALSKNYIDAIDDISYVIKLDPSNANALYWRGIYYKETDKFQDAIKDFEQVLKFQPDNWQALADRADGYAKSGNEKLALADYQKLLADAPRYPEKEAITKLADQQIFELNRENHKPELTLFDPVADNFNIQVPNDKKSITVKGKITDESPIKSLIVNGQEISVTAVDNDFEFAAVVKLGDVQEIQISVTDIYDNTDNLMYHLVKNETAKPQIALFTPKPSGNGVITLPEDNSVTLYVEGKITDESTIESIFVDGKAVDFDHDADNPAFSAIVDISNKNRFSITVTDRYGNSTEQTYTLEKVAIAATGTASQANSVQVPAVEEVSQ